MEGVRDLQVTPNVDPILLYGLLDSIGRSAIVIDAIGIFDSLFDSKGVLVRDCKAILGHTDRRVLDERSIRVTREFEWQTSYLYKGNPWEFP